MHRNRLLDTLELNSIFSEMALIDGALRSATVVTNTDVTWCQYRKQFIFMLSRTLYFVLLVMRVLTLRLRTSNKAI